MNLPNNIPQNANPPMVWLLVAALMIVILALAAPSPRISNSIQPGAVQPANLQPSAVTSAAQPVPQAVPVPTPPQYQSIVPALNSATPVPSGTQPVLQPVQTPPGTVQQFSTTGGLQ